jgi:2-aminobenzoate-CoA ligase
MSAYTAHVDTYTRDVLPVRSEWPDFINLDRLGYPARLNCTEALLDRAIAAGHGSRRCIVTPNDCWTYVDLAMRVDRLAHVLREDLGLRPGERVLLRSPNNAWLAAFWLAVAKAGGVVVNTMALLRARELAVILDRARVRLAVCDTRLEAELEAARADAPGLERIVYFDASGPREFDWTGKPAHFQAVPTAADDVVLIAFTSGTTGVPKGAMHFHRDILATCDTFSRHVLKPAPDDLFAGSAPMAFTFGLGGHLLFPLHAGSATLLLEDARPDPLAAAIDEFGVTILFTAPTAYRYLAGLRTDLASLAKCVSAGEPLPRTTFENWERRTGLKIIDGLGSTEMLHIFITSAGDQIRPGATGIPVPLYEARVVDADRNPVPPGTAGRLCVRGPTGCRYLNDPRQRDYVQDGWNYTGDTYRMDHDGYFFFEARADDMIISAGYNIGAPEVEEALLAHPRVGECAVIGVPDEERGQSVKAFVVLRPDSPPGDAVLVKDLQVFVKSRIAPFKYPRVIEFVDSLPRTATGKLQRFRLRESDRQHPPG